MTDENTILNSISKNNKKYPLCTQNLYIDIN
jgi:hypothetical protein